MYISWMVVCKMLDLRLSAGTDVVEGEALFFVLWAASEMSLKADCVAALPFSQAEAVNYSLHI